LRFKRTAKRLTVMATFGQERQEPIEMAELPPIPPKSNQLAHLLGSSSVRSDFPYRFRIQGKIPPQIIISNQLIARKDGLLKEGLSFWTKAPL